MKIINLLFAFVFLACACDSNKQEQSEKQQINAKITDAAVLHQSIKALNEVIINDIFVPPVSSRIYAYTALASYEALHHEYNDYQSITSQLNGFEPMPQPEAGKTYSFAVASIKAFFTVGKGLIHSPAELEEAENKLLSTVKPQLSEDVFQRSLDFGIAVANVIKKRISKDNYKETRGMARYTPIAGEEHWQPTAPAYMDAVEPYWNKITPLALENPAQFKPEIPYKFDLDKNSPFYKETLEVYNVIRNLTDEQKKIALFWDNNPFVMVYEGHLEYAIKKISPGGHWVQIAMLAAEHTKADLIKASESYALLSVGLLDGFISCWDEKYRSNYVRPQTVIEKHIDNKWIPFIQTPPFPEYTSGHSVVSHAAATILTAQYGENFAFVDSTQIEYGLPSRKFKSFLDASAEASISRLYGGIHFRKALDNGSAQGIKVGDWVIKRIKTRKELPI
ncbi:MAG: phosphatase PAP2 family protein [Cytophagales bacterium]|nr:MAG: phosphatase PAP2 family protein [Cytophagales bacterium]